jgi:hypothetical protein
MASAKKTTKKATTTKSRQRAIVQEEGPQYQVLEPSFIDNVLYGPNEPAGDKVTYYGLPGSKLRPLNEAAKARKQQVRDIRTDPELDADEKAAALKELSDEFNGVEEADAWADGEDDGDDTDPRAFNARNTKPLPDGERAELEKHAQASVDATRAKEADDTNLVRVKLQGHQFESETTLQGATPVLDSQGKGAKAEAAKASK